LLGDCIINRSGPNRKCVFFCLLSLALGVVTVLGGQIPPGRRDWGLNFNGYVVLHMHEGLATFGVKIYPEGFSRPRRYFSYGNRELLPGLWYYDGKYNHDPEYNERIDKIMQEGKWEEPNEEYRIQETEYGRTKRTGNQALSLRFSCAKQSQFGNRSHRAGSRRGESAKMARKLTLVNFRVTVSNSLTSGDQMT